MQCIYVMQSWIFSIISLQCHMIIRNHSNMLIWCSRYFFLLTKLKTFVQFNIFLETYRFSFFNILWKTAFIWNRNLFKIVLLSLLITLMQLKLCMWFVSSLQGQGIFWQTVCQLRLAIGKANCGTPNYQHAMGNSQSTMLFSVFPARYHRTA